MINVKFKFPDWERKIRNAEAELNLFLAAQIQFNRGMLFDQEGAYNGRPRWQDLKFRRGQILSKRGDLRKSIAPYNPKGQAGPDGIVRFSGDTITVGTLVRYARMMNDGTEKMPGGVLRPKNARFLKIPLPSSKNSTWEGKMARVTAHREGKQRFIFAKSVRIPARPFDDWNKEDQAEIDAALLNKVSQILNRGK